MLVRIVAWNGIVTANELELASAVVQALVGLAPSREEYVEAVDAYSEILCANSAPGNVDWALNAAEMLAVQASPDKESRLRFFMAVIEMARSCAHRLSSVQYELLSLLALDYGCSGLLESFPCGDSAGGDLARRVDYTGLIAIYTLTEQAGQRARQFLRKMYPKARLELNPDHVATDKLKGLAANPDIFVFAWKSSKHQASAPTTTAPTPASASIGPDGVDFGAAVFGSPGNFNNEPVAAGIGRGAMIHVVGWQYYSGDGWNDENVMRLRFQLKYTPPPN